MQQARFRVAIVGAYGQFGQRIASALAGDAGIELVLCGRRLEAAQSLAEQLQQQDPCARVSAAALDVDASGLPAAIAALQAQLLIHTAGPFQNRDYRVAEAALQCGAHYVDLADAREYVMGIGRIDPIACAHERWAIAGASSVPGLSAAVVEALQRRFSRLDGVVTAISPGNRTARGLATTRAILGYVGRPFTALIDGRWQTVHGWQSLRRLASPATGTRWVARCDVPDLSVLPTRYPQLQYCDFRAGLELRRMHFGLWLASWLVRAGLLPTLQTWAKPLLAISERWIDSGSDVGVMTVEVAGRDLAGTPLELRWRIVAEHGSGPQIPATAAVVIARKLARGQLPGAGARACVDLFTLDEFMQALATFPIRATLESVPAVMSHE